MIYKENKKHIGIYKIFEIDRYTRKKKQIDEIHNILTNNCIEAEAKIFMGITPDIEIKYLGIGDDNITPDPTNSFINSEVFRTYRVAYPTYSSGSVITEFYIADSEANGIDIQELGIFAGSQANSSLNTGILISHALWNYGVKSSGIELLIRRVDTIS